MLDDIERAGVKIGVEVVLKDKECSKRGDPHNIRC